MNDPSEIQSPIACDMGALSPSQRDTHLATSRALFAKVQAIQELSDGYEFRLDQYPQRIVEAAEFVSFEKLCCPFLNFAIEVKAEHGPVWLRVTGREGVKAFIREEISALLGNVIEWK